MLRSAAFGIAITIIIIVVVATSAVVSAQQPLGEEQVPSSEEMDMQREATQNTILERARSKLGQPADVVRPHHLVNFALNPKKDVGRFDTADHGRMKDNEKGILVIDRNAKHIGVWSSDTGTIIHSSPQEKKVVEEPFKKAKASFPNGWRRIGPDGKLQKTFEVSQDLKEMLAGQGKLREKP